MVAADLFTVEAWTRQGLQRFIVPFFINLSTRKVEIAGIASVADGLWMSRIGRNITECLVISVVPARIAAYVYIQVGGKTK